MSIDFENQDGLLLGIDVGGTDVKLGLVDHGGEIRKSHRTSTPPLGTPERVFQYAVDFALSALDTMPEYRKIVGVGLAVPGVLDTREFVLREVVNLPGWVEVPLRDVLAQTTKLPSAVVNDANSAAYAEHAMRDLRDDSLALVTLGTGIGCGLVLKGSPYGGDHGCGGELGHIAIEFGDDALPCTCGSKGHLETYAGAAGVIARLQKALGQQGEDHAHLSRPDVTPRDIAETAANGNELCDQIILDTASYIGRAVGMLGQSLDPAVVLLGGAMTFGGHSSETGQRFLKQVRDTVRETTLVQVGGNIVIDFASLGNDAGIVGAAMVAKQEASNCD